MNAVIETSGLGKRYRLGKSAWGYSTLREQLTMALSMGQRVARSDVEQRAVWAIRDLDLAVGDGEAVGIIGRNGAGKSTLVRVLSGITEPTAGWARTRGSIASLLEVGTGFHPELTGRENVYLNGSLLGMRRRETDQALDSIVEFAGVERFLDTPLKRYSSGMALRLAFAVAAHLEPDILIVDEVLAVGDAEFQRRCLGRIADLERAGRTVIFISHDLGAVARLCSRVIWLEQGRLLEDGPPGQTIESYLRAGVTALSSELVYGELQRLEVRLLSEHGDATDAPRRDQPILIEIDFESGRSLADMDIAVYLVNRAGLRVVSENRSDALTDERPLPSRGRVLVELPPFLTAGDYTLGIWIGNDYEDVFYSEVGHFTVLPRPGDREESLSRGRVVQPPVTWRVVGD